MKARATEAFLSSLTAIVGGAHLITAASATRQFRTAFRGGDGTALAVALPGSLLELWRVLNACVAESKIIIMQAANTGLTGGSTPAARGYDREVVVINTMRMARIFLVNGGREVICLPGATLHQLERLLEPIGREPHSVLGSSCFGASVIGGICNNSGGALTRRGPAYTEMALYAQVTESRKVRLVNHLDVGLSEEPEEALRQLERGEFRVSGLPSARKSGSDDEYVRRIRDSERRLPLRFNADPSRLFETSGCAGKLAVFAVRVDTFPKERETRVFYIGANRPAVLSELRRHILRQFESLPVSGEYIHAGAFDLAERFGKDIFLAIRHLGAGSLPRLSRLTQRLAEIQRRVTGRPGSLLERNLHRLSRLLPPHLPRRIRAYRGSFEHHLLLKVAGAGIREARNHLETIFPSRDGGFFECTPDEAEKAFLHRFVVAGAAKRFLDLQRPGAEEMVALDVALRPDDDDWSSFVPESLRSQVHTAVCYGHFFCHVFHVDYLVQKAADVEGVRECLKQWLDGRGARYPAEHNVGLLYRAPPELVEFYRSLDPTNSFNPGIGLTSMRGDWR
ncbi:MAG TPA: D-lactate dehydrogenase [Steroidobacteraceae bacterium]|nr:D-lactate dehydrogenase [Steroidobacteraceae bacterium]